MIAALVSQARGVALFVRDDVPMRVLVESPRVVEPLTTFEFVREVSQIVDGERVEAVDEEAVARLLEERRDRERLLLASVVLIDSTLPPEVREEAAAAWTEGWSESAWEWVEGVLLATPAPPGADFEGAVELLGNKGHLLAETAKLLPFVGAATVAWHEESTRSSAGDVASARADAVRQGWFRARVRELAQADQERRRGRKVVRAKAVHTVAEEPFICGAVELSGRIGRLLVEPTRTSLPDVFVMHRDIRPQNVIEAGVRDSVLIMDVCLGGRQVRSRDRCAFFYVGRSARERLDPFGQLGELRNVTVVHFAGHGAADHTSRTWEEGLRGVLEARKLDEAVSHGAGYAIKFLETPRPQNRTWGLFGPDRNIRCKFTGDDGSIFGVLLHRMLADRVSGVPRERAGWCEAVRVDRELRLAEGTSVRVVREMRRRVAEAGIGEGVLEERGDEVRVDVGCAAAAK